MKAEEIDRLAILAAEAARDLALGRGESFVSADYEGKKAYEAFVHEKIYEAEMDEIAYLFGESQEEARDRMLWHEEG